MSDGRRTWTALHCFLDRPPADVDALLVESLGPTLDGLRQRGDLADRFFIRYAEGGPHLRIRLADAAPGVVSWLATEFGRHCTVAEAGYVPEVERYGGAGAIAAAEEVFCRSTDVALAVLAARATTARLTVATELIMATAFALDLDRLGTGRWLRTHAAGWRWQSEAALLPPVIAETRTVAVLATRTPALQRRWAAIRDRVTEPAGDDAVAAWAATVRLARHRLEGGNTAGPVTGRWPGIWASHLHMLLNRIGVAPDEERSLCRLVAGAAVLPDGITPFFADGVTAPDRMYQEASKYLPGQIDAQAPQRPVVSADLARPVVSRPLPVTPPVRPPAAPPVPLPAAGGGLGPLADALRCRRSGHGRFAGPVTATDLGTLLWTATARTADARLPYPSAGRLYVAGLRVIARRVDGLAPGMYEVDPHARAVRPVGPAPSPADVDATSMWFGASVTGGIDLREAPAVLGLHVQVSRIRSRYGLRSLRFALLEAGHLAQNLALVAAATDLELGLIGGFYDDVANEVFGLDGIDRFVVYLLPLGHRDG